MHDVIRDYLREKVTESQLAYLPLCGWTPQRSACPASRHLLPLPLQAPWSLHGGNYLCRHAICESTCSPQGAR